MKIIVNAHTIQLNKTTIVNAGEYNVQTCQFQFSEEYNGLVKVALFSTCENTYQINIVNDECMIPSEILQEEGNVMLGVYGYEVDGEDLIKRYSPTPIYFTIDKGSYGTGEQPTPPTPSVIEQLQQQITDNANNISTLQDLVSTNTSDINDIKNIIPTLAKKTEIPTKTSQLTNDSNFAYKSDIPDVSNYVEKDTTELENYTLTNDLSQVATTGDYDDLLNKPTIPVVPTNVSAFNNDAGYITNTVNNLTNYTLKTSTGSLIDLEVNSSTYVVTLYLKDIDGNVISTDTIDLPLESVVVSGSFDSTNKKIVLTLQNGNTVDIPVGDLVAGLQTEITSTNKLNADYIDDSNSGKKLVTTTQINTWNAKLDSSALTNYVKNNDYATNTTGGVIKYSVSYGTTVGSDGVLKSSSKNYSQYTSANDNLIIGKGTLENVIAGKGLTTKAYVDGLVGNIDTILETLTVGNGV